MYDFASAFAPGFGLRGSLGSSVAGSADCVSSMGRGFGSLPFGGGALKARTLGADGRSTKWGDSGATTLRRWVVVEIYLIEQLGTRQAV